MRLRRRTVLTLAAGALVFPRSAWAGEEVAPAETFAQVTLTALGYLRSLAPFERAGGVTITCLHTSDLSSRSHAADLAGALRTVGQSRPVGGAHRVLRAELHPWGGGDDLAAQLAKKSATVLVLGLGLSGAVEELTTLSRREHLLTVAVESARVREGLGFGAALVDRRPQLYVNRRATDAEGFPFQPALLRRATVFDA